MNIETHSNNNTSSVLPKTESLETKPNEGSFNTELLKVDLNKLKKHLTCPLCNGIFRTPITINECMDTFCKACLCKEFYNKPGNTRCPKCNSDLGGKPMETFIFDNSMDSLIKILFPEFEQIDKENTQRMYEIFREAKTPLPGDPALDKKTKPNLSISILPHKPDNVNKILPKLDSTKIQVAPNMDMMKFKKYLALRLKAHDCEIKENEIEVYFKNNIMRDDFSFDNIEKQYGFNLNEKLIFSYSRKINLDEKEK